MRRLEVVKLNDYIRPNPHELLSIGREYVTNGTDNDYFYYVESRYLGSPTNQAVIDSYVNYIIGEGLEAVEGISQEDLDSILDEENLRLIVTEFKMQGNAPVQIVYAQTEERLVAKLYSLPAKTVAIQKQSDMSDDIEGFYYSFDWKNKTNFPPYPVPSFNCGNEDIKESEIIYIKRQSPQPLFSLPDYQSGLQYCEVEEEMSNYYLNHIKNNFSAGKVININQGETLSEEAEEEVERLLKQKLTGSSKAGALIISFNNNAEQATTVESIEITDAYKQFETLSTESRQKIMLAHKVTNPSLFGFSQATGFSDGGNELSTSLRMLYRSQINPIRRVIIKYLEKVLRVNNPDTKLRFKDFKELEIE